MGSAGVRSWTARIVEPIPAAISAAEIDTADPIALFLFVEYVLRVPQ